MKKKTFEKPTVRLVELLNMEGVLTGSQNMTTPTPPNKVGASAPDMNWGN